MPADTVSFPGGYDITEILAAIVGLIILLQAYVYPFTLMVPTPP